MKPRRVADDEAALFALRTDEERLRALEPDSLRLVHHWLRRAHVSWMDRESLENAGRVGGWRALQSWDRQRGVRFSTHLMNEVRWELCRAARYQHPNGPGAWNERRYADAVSMDSPLPGSRRCLRDRLAARADSDDPYAELLGAHEEFERACAALGRLDRRARTVIVLRIFEARPAIEVARRMGYSKQWVYDTERRALAQLRWELAREGANGGTGTSD